MAGWHYHYQLAQQTSSFQTFSYPTDSNGYQAAQAYWAYNYYQQQAQAARAQQAGATTPQTTAPIPVAPASTTQQNANVAVIPTAQPAASTSTFSTYNPSYARDSAGSTRGGRKSQLRGLFSKECEFFLHFILFSFLLAAFLAFFRPISPSRCGEHLMPMLSDALCHRRLVVVGEFPKLAILALKNKSYTLLKHITHGTPCGRKSRRSQPLVMCAVCWRLPHVITSNIVGPSPAFILMIVYAGQPYTL